jgi:hypothetical protein
MDETDLTQEDLEGYIAEQKQTVNEACNRLLLFQGVPSLHDLPELDDEQPDLVALQNRNRGPAEIQSNTMAYFTTGTGRAAQQFFVITILLLVT